MMKSWSIPIGRFFGVDLRLHLVFFLLVMFVLFPALDPAPANTGGVGRGLAIIGMVALAVLFHEIGHILVGRKKGIAPRTIMLLPIGGVHLRDGSHNENPPQVSSEVWTALAGPAVNFLLGGIAALIDLGVKSHHLLLLPLITQADPLKTFVWINLGLGILNLLPAYPLDGGQILRAFLAEKATPLSGGMTYSAATKRAVMIGQAFAMFLIFAGIRNTNLMLIGIFLFVAVQIEDRTLLFHSIIESVKLEEIMLTDFSTLSSADTLEDALNKAVHSLQDDFPVIRGGDMVGVISKQNILRALRSDGNGYVQSAMKKAFETATKSESLAGAFRRITKGTTIIPIVDEDRLVGIVTLQNLMHSMSVLAESRKLSRDEEE